QLRRKRARDPRHGIRRARHSRPGGDPARPCRRRARHRAHGLPLRPRRGEAAAGRRRLRQRDHPPAVAQYQQCRARAGGTGGASPARAGRHPGRAGRARRLEPARSGPQGRDRHGSARLVGRLPRRRQFPLSALLFRQFRPRRQLCVLLGSRVGLVDSARPPHHRRCGAHSPVPADRRAGLPRRAVAVPLVPHRPVGEAPGRHGVGCVGDLQRSTLDGSAARAVIPLLTRRLLLALPTLLGVLVVAFLLLNVAPGDPVTAMVGERADSATIARLRAELRLDDPLPAQFAHYVWDVVRGDLGRSYITQRPIVQDLRERFPKTAELALAAMALAAVSGITLRVPAAVRPGRRDGRRAVPGSPTSVATCLVAAMAVLAPVRANYPTAGALTETIFGWPGLGRYVLTAIDRRDLPAIQGSILFMSVVFVVVNLVTDLLYAKADPRISYD